MGVAPIGVPARDAAAPLGRPVSVLKRLAVAAGVLVVLLAMPVVWVSAQASAAAAPDLGSIGIRLVDTPAEAVDDPRARLYVVDHLAPGSAIQRRIEVVNTSASTVHVELYSAAATIEAGKFIGADGHASNDLSTWTTIAPGALDVPAGGRVIVVVAIAVPAGAVAGEQYAAVWAEVRSGSEGAVTQVNRVGIRLYVSVGPGGEPASDFTIDSLTAERAPDGRPMILALVRNTGQRALDMTGTIRLLNGPGGLSAGPFPAAPGTTLGIGKTGEIVIALDKQLPAGPWDVEIVLRSGTVERSAQATVTFPASGSSIPVAASAIRPWWLYPGIAVGLLLLLFVLAMLVVRHRRRPRLLEHAHVPPARLPSPLVAPGLVGDVFVAVKGRHSAPRPEMAAKP